MYPRFLQFGAFVISTYGVLAVVAAFAAIALWKSLARRLALDGEKIQTAGLIAVTAIILGARLAVVVANWRGFLVAPLLILMAGTLTTGSAAAYGVLLAIAAAGLYLWRVRLPLVPALACATPAILLALGVLDIANFAAGSHYGAPATVPWAVTYTSRFAARLTGVPLGLPLHPVQLYAATGHFVLAAVLIGLLRHTHRLLEVPGMALFADGVLRFVLAPLGGSYAGSASLAHIATAPQAVAMVMVLAGGLLWLRPSERGALHA